MACNVDKMKVQKPTFLLGYWRAIEHLEFYYFAGSHFFNIENLQIHDSTFE